MQARQQTHSKSGRWQLERYAHILWGLCWKLWGKVMVKSDGVWHWVWLWFVLTAVWVRHWEWGSGYIRGIVAERGAEGGWHLLTGRPALEEPNVAAMHPDGGIIYQTPPGRKNTVCRWLEEDDWQFRRNPELSLKIQSVPRSKHSASVTKTSQLMLYREIMAVCSEIHTKHINNLVWKERRIVEC